MRESFKGFIYIPFAINTCINSILKKFIIVLEKKLFSIVWFNCAKFKSSNQL